MKTYLALAVCALSACATPAPKGQPSISEIAAQFKFREVKKVERVNIVVHRDADVQKTCLPIVGQASLACAVPDTSPGVCELWIHPDAPPEIIQHEALHCLGWVHDQ